MSALPALQARGSEPGKAAQDPPIRLLIVDDSSVARAVLARMVERHADLKVVATAGSASEGIDALRAVSVDIVLLDVEMPGGSGVDALPKILSAGQGARVLVVSSIAEEGAEVVVRALAAGAADTLPKPGAGVFGGRFSDILAERLRRIGRAAPDRKAPEESVIPFQPICLRAASSAPLGCVAIGASTGGIHALNELLSGMRAPIGAPILVTQHLPPLFMPYFARQLEVAAGRPTQVAADGDRLCPDHIYVAPGTAHLGVERRGSGVHVRLDARPSPSGCLPSVDPMLLSVADVYGAAAIAVILSGMGRDGTVGCGQLVAQGGTVLVQDQQSCAIWGMPRAAAEAGLASAIMPPREIGRRISHRAGDTKWN